MANALADYKDLVSRYRESYLLGSVSELLHWDMQTMMPPKGAEKRGEQLALLSGLQHSRLVDPQMGELVHRLEAKAQGLDGEQQANVREIARDYRIAAKIPQRLVEELSRHQSASHEAWVKAREAADFAQFAPFLEKMVRLTAEQAEYLGYEETPLDALIDLYEPEARASMLTRLFDEVKAATIPLLKQVLDSRVKADRKFLARDYPAGLQKQFGEEVMRKVGFDTEGGRIDTSVHPFCSGSLGDVRITTRYRTDAPQQALFGIIHETGHALYEQGLNSDFLGTPLAQALSMGLHESQSRLWENFIGRSRAFWTHFYPRLKEIFAAPLADVSLDQFVLAINHVAPSLVRVEADELTYDLHIIVRFEIERDLFAGKLAIADLPEVWNEKMRSYLGVTPPDNGKEGVLQDVHWSGGAFGYFPSYSLGNMVAAQLWDTMRRAMPDLEQRMEAGIFGDILAWLRENVHRYGRRFTRDELLQRVTGKPLDTGHYVKYLQQKFGGLYRVEG